MADRDAQADQPCGQGSIGVLGITAPGASIVHQQAIRQAIAAEGLGKGLLYPYRLLVRQGTQAKVEARVIIQNCQGRGNFLPRPADDYMDPGNATDCRA